MLGPNNDLMIESVEEEGTTVGFCLENFDSD